MGWVEKCTFGHGKERDQGRERWRGKGWWWGSEDFRGVYEKLLRLIRHIFRCAHRGSRRIPCMFPKHPIESHLRTQWVKRKRRTTGYHQNIKTFEGSVRTVVLSSTTISFCNHSNTIHFKIPPIDQPPSPESIFQNKVANQIPFPVLDILFFFYLFNNSFFALSQPLASIPSGCENQAWSL